MQLFDVPSEVDLNRDNILEKIGVLRLKKLDLIIREAVQSFIDDYGDQMFWLSSRTIASHIHDNMHKCCKKLLSIEDKMRLVTQNNTFKLILDDVNLVLQFKKFNKKKLTSNIPTNACLAFVRQSPTLFPSFVKLTVGYRLNKSSLSGNFLEETMIACHNNEYANHWSTKISDAVNSLIKQTDSTVPSQVPTRTYKISPKKDLLIISQTE